MGEFEAVVKCHDSAIAWIPGEISMEKVLSIGEG